MRKISRKGLIKKLDKLVIDIVRLRDNYTCQYCGKKVTDRNAHVSHVIPRSAGNKLRWDLKNLKLLCFHCHINWWHKNPVESGAWFKNKFPKRYKYLQDNRGIAIYKNYDLENIKQKLTKEYERYLAEQKR